MLKRTPSSTPYRHTYDAARAGDDGVYSMAIIPHTRLDAPTTELDSGHDTHDIKAVTLTICVHSPRWN